VLSVSSLSWRGCRTSHFEPKRLQMFSWPRKCFHASVETKPFQSRLSLSDTLSFGQDSLFLSPSLSRYIFCWVLRAHFNRPASPLDTKCYHERWNFPTLVFNLPSLRRPSASTNKAQGLQPNLGLSKLVYVFYPHNVLWKDKPGWFTNVVN